MAQNVVRRLIESGMHFTEDSQVKAEKLVKDLVKGGEVRRKDAEATLQALATRGKQTTEHILSLVQAEVAKQMSRFTERMDDVEDRLEDYAEQFGIKAKKSATARPAASEPAAARTAPAKKAPAKKVAAKKVAAKKAVVKKAPAKKAAVKKAAAKKSAPVKKASAKQVAAKKAPAKKSS